MTAPTSGPSTVPIPPMMTINSNFPPDSEGLKGLDKDGIQVQNTGSYAGKKCADQKTGQLAPKDIYAHRLRGHIIIPYGHEGQAQFRSKQTVYKKD